MELMEAGMPELVIIGTGEYSFPPIPHSFWIDQYLGFAPGAGYRDAAWYRRKIGFTGISMNFDPKTGQKRMPEEGVFEYALHAAEGAITSAGIDRSEITQLLYTSCTPREERFSRDVICLKDALGLKSTTRFCEESQGCSGLANQLYSALEHASLEPDSLSLLVASNDTFGNLDRERYQKHKNALLSPGMFADAAGALLLRRKRDRNEGPRLVDLYEASCSEYPLVRWEVGGTDNPVTHDNLDRRVYLMDPEDIAEQFALRVQEVWEYFQLRHCLTVDQVDAFYFHQASAEALWRIQGALGIPSDKMPMLCHEMGNPVAASIPILIHRDFTSGRWHELNIAVTIKIGAGEVYGGSVWEK